MGKIISFEGVDGVGKTTVINTLKEELIKQDKSVLVIQEPGTTEFGQEIRELIKKPTNRSQLADVLLFIAARADMVQKVLKPASKIYDYILIDRYIDSTIAYQGYGNGNDISLLDYLNRAVINNILPNKTILLTIPLDVAEDRRKKRGEASDKYEDTEFLKRVEDGYEKLAYNNPDRIVKIPNIKLDNTIKEIIKVINSNETVQHKREKLAKSHEERLTYRAVVGRPGRDLDGNPTLLLTKVKRKSGRTTMTDHIWIPYSREIVKIGTIVTGDMIEFTADVDTYEHVGQNGNVYLEYGLANITDVKLIQAVPIPKTEENFQRKSMDDILSITIDELYKEMLSRYIRFVTAMCLKYFRTEQ